MRHKHREGRLGYEEGQQRISVWGGEAERLNRSLVLLCLEAAGLISDHSSLGQRASVRGHVSQTICSIYHEAGASQSIGGPPADWNLERDMPVGRSRKRPLCDGIRPYLRPNQTAILRPAVRQRLKAAAILAHTEYVACQMPSCKMTPAEQRCRRCKRR